MAGHMGAPTFRDQRSKGLRRNRYSPRTFIAAAHLRGRFRIEAPPTLGPLPELGIYAIQPFGQHSACKVRALKETLIECFGERALNAQETL